MMMHKSITTDRIMQAIEDDDHIGFCTFCGEEHAGIEPDARKYKCTNCESKNVYGAEELLIMTEN